MNKREFSKEFLDFFDNQFETLAKLKNEIEIESMIDKILMVN